MSHTFGVKQCPIHGFYSAIHGSCPHCAVKNGGVLCDVSQGPCACGAFHDPPPIVESRCLDYDDGVAAERRRIMEAVEKLAPAGWRNRYLPGGGWWVSDHPPARKSEDEDEIESIPVYDLAALRREIEQP